MGRWGSETIQEEREEEWKKPLSTSLFSTLYDFRSCLHICLCLVPPPLPTVRHLLRLKSEGTRSVKRSSTQLTSFRYKYECPECKLTPLYLWGIICIYLSTQVYDSTRIFFMLSNWHFLIGPIILLLPLIWHTRFIRSGLLHCKLYSGLTVLHQSVHFYTVLTYCSRSRSHSEKTSFISFFFYQVPPTSFSLIALSFALLSTPKLLSDLGLVRARTSRKVFKVSTP